MPGRYGWVAVGVAEQLTALATELEDALAQARLAPKDKRPFRPHLTIGRNKSRHRSRELASAIESAAGVEIGQMTVAAFVLMRSQLTASGPVYSVIERFSLGNGNGSL